MPVLVEEAIAERSYEKNGNRLFENRMVTATEIARVGEEKDFLGERHERSGWFLPDSADFNRFVL